MVIRRRTQFELNKAEDRAHILEGLRIALDHIDEIIKLIRSSQTGEEAKRGLTEQFNLSERQAQAILDMRLQRLTGLERDKIEEEYKALVELIEELKFILANEYRVIEIIREEITEIRDRYSDDRRTEIVAGGVEVFEDEDLIPVENSVLTLTNKGYIKRLPANTYKSQKRGGRGVQGMGTNENDFVEHLLNTSTHDTILFFTNKGKVYRARGFEIPEYGRTAKGLPLINLLGIEKDEHVTAMIPMATFEEDSYFIFTTKHGVTKRTPVSGFAHIRANGLIAISLRDEDELIAVRLTDGKKQIIIGTRQGKLVRFEETDIRSMGRTAGGVRGIRLKDDDYVVGMEIIEPGQEILVVTEKGYGKRTPESEYRLQTRGGMGVKTCQITEKNGPLCAVKAVEGLEDLMLITINGMLIRMDVNDISITGRSTQGVRLMRLSNNELIATVAKVAKEDEEEETDDEIVEEVASNNEDDSTSIEE